MALDATFHQGDPLMVDYTPTAAVAAGAVILVGGRPLVCHVSIEANRMGALATAGGVYRMTASGNYAPGAKVYWNDTTKKITTATGVMPHFGWIVPNSDPAADGDPVIVEHRPDGSATGA